MRQRLLPLLALALVSTTLTACGNKHENPTHAESEAIYVSLGPENGPFLKYQVQVSRQLNPGDFQNLAASGDLEKTDPEDSEYFTDIPASELQLEKDPAKPINNEVYFGVFLQAANDTDQPLRTAALSGFEIRDSLWVEGAPDAEEHVFEPMSASNARAPANPFLYRQGVVPAAVGTGSGTWPLPGSGAGSSTTAAYLLIFKIPQSKLENRPLVLHMKGPTGGEAEVDLDV